MRIATPVILIGATFIGTLVGPPPMALAADIELVRVWPTKIRYETDEPIVGEITIGNHGETISPSRTSIGGWLCAVRIRKGAKALTRIRGSSRHGFATCAASTTTASRSSSGRPTT